MAAPFKNTFSRRSFLYRRAKSTKSKFQPGFDPFSYTQGRWLDRDRERRDARSLHFDFDALMDIAVKSSPGARRVTHCEKKEGGFNRVFVIRLDNKGTVLARLPTRLAGPPRLTVSSEVATFRFVKERTDIPVPNVLAWNAEPNNSVGTEYMILDVIPGVPLKDKWKDMTASQHVGCIRSIGRLCKEMCRINFPLYGSLYPNSHAPPSAVKLNESFCIGPVCAPQHWNCGLDYTASASQPSGYQGPWHNLDDYFSDLIARAKSSLSVLGGESPASHLESLDALYRTLCRLTSTELVKGASGAVLFHPDLHTRNIFVDSEDPTKITGVIDWQSASIEPAFVFAAETPDFAEEIPEDEDPGDITDEERTANAKLRADVDFCVKAWVVMQQACEKLRPASRLDPTLLQVLAAPSFGWIDKEIILNTLLDNLAKEWKELDLPDEYQASRRLQDHLVQLLGCDNDGWVPADRWEEVLPRYQLEFSRFVESVIQSEECTTDQDKTIAVEKASRLWPYDQR